MKFESETSFVGPLDLVVDVLTSEELLRAREKAAGVTQEVEFAKDGDTHSFRLQVPADRIPAAVRSFLPNGMKIFATATTVVQSQAGRIHGAKIPYVIDVSGAPASGSLTMLLADGGVTTPAKITGEIKVSLPLIGGRIEKMAVDQLGKIMSRDTAIVNAEIARRRADGQADSAP
ncbi:DUF2505 domain-containing protein [Trueperella pecoris]|uniref:DUF2505 domain-containing protein n=1 Tax=Trueperella pecoris TaxID=2733571 RepID=A0A7M1QWF8_9ACTO|nr:DUF2505 domain-containing protein [Trueperella pecoris]QOR46171.1 DUF2505 domain-containing protein [Trueperella pecoris]